MTSPMPPDDELPILDLSPEDTDDVEYIFEEVSDEEIEEGNHLGYTIDVNDDFDSGGSRPR